MDVIKTGIIMWALRGALLANLLLGCWLLKMAVAGTRVLFRI